ncbi:MAG: PilZ domain-containing protein [Bdellovibrionaceae bacterium]|nr:PilZ domain-containing protein [Pseudobdellovibrionaceae bacterium]
MFKIDEKELKDPFVKKWYTKVQDKETGPYSYAELCIMLANKDLLDTEEVTYLGHGEWVLISTDDLFQPLAVRKFLDENNINLDSDIPLRKSIRVPLSAEIALICDGRMFKAQSMDMSTTGLMIKTLKSGLKQNSKLRMHVYKNDEQKIPAINLNGIIVRKLDKSDNKFDYFGINFENLSTEQREIIHNLIRMCILQGTSEHAVREVFGLRIKGLDYGPSFSVA